MNTKFLTELYNMASDPLVDQFAFVQVLKKALELSYRTSANLGNYYTTISHLSGNNNFPPHTLPNGYTFEVSKPGCAHEYVDVGFMNKKMVCKHCNREQA